MSDFEEVDDALIASLSPASSTTHTVGTPQPQVTAVRFVILDTIDYERYVRFGRQQDQL